MSFRNPILAGNVLVRNAIQSPNYSPGAAGWSIKNDGTAELNATIFRGTIVIENNAQSLLIYNGTPAAGNLIGSWAAVAGTDGFGNAYPAGQTVQSGASQTVTEIIANEVIQRWITGNPNSQNPAFLQASASGAGAAQIDQFLIQSGQNATNTDVAGLVLHSNNNNGAQTASAYLYYEGAGGQTNYLTVSASGVTILAGSIAAAKPGTGTQALPAVAEIWNSPSLAAGWTTGSAPNPPLRYRRLADSGAVKIWGYAAYAGTPAAGAAVFTLPAGYASATYVHVSGSGYDSHNDAQVPIQVSQGGAVILMKAAGLDPNVFFDVTIYPDF